MERVAALLKKDCFPEALVRLWVLAGDAQRLNKWEQARNQASLETDVDVLITQLQEPNMPSPAELIKKPLVLIRAIDRLLRDEMDFRRLPLAPFCEEKQFFWLLPDLLASKNRTSLDGQATNRSAWFVHHLVIPGRTSQDVKVTLSQSNGKAAANFQGLLKTNANLKIWIGHFSDDADVQWDKNSSPAGNWRCTDVRPHAIRWEAMLSQMQAAKACSANIVLFPEFSIDLAQRRALSDWLVQHKWESLIYVVPGSFHEELGAEGCFNTAPLLAATGEPLLVHRKLRLYGLIDNPAESVEIGNTIHVMATPIGYFTILICKDFMDVNPKVNDLLQDVPVDWVLVPSFGDDKTIKAHKRRAQTLATITIGANSAIANSANTAVAAKKNQVAQLPGFGHCRFGQESEDVSIDGGIIEFPLFSEQPEPRKLRLAK